MKIIIKIEKKKKIRTNTSLSLLATQTNTEKEREREERSQVCNVYIEKKIINQFSLKSRSNPKKIQPKSISLISS